MSYTIPWNATVNGDTTKHILRHNSYGQHQRKLFENNLNNVPIVTSSNEVSANIFLHVQNINATWKNLKNVLNIYLEQSLFGRSLISAPICGSNHLYNEKLCIRWYLLAATMPMFRISSDKPRRNPESLPNKYIRDIVYNAVKKRDMLLPYFYSSLNDNNIVVRPMFYDFYEDDNTLLLDEQYMIGQSLLIAQPLRENLRNIKVYLPQKIKLWYEFWGGQKYSNGWIKMPVVESDWIMFIAEGHTIPLKWVSGTIILTINLMLYFHTCFIFFYDKNSFYCLKYSRRLTLGSPYTVLISIVMVVLLPFVARTRVDSDDEFDFPN